MAKLQILKKISELHSTDMSGEEAHRSALRHRRILLSTFAAAFSKVISIAAQLISVPLTLHYLGAERYGMWLTISSFITIMSFADLGMGNGLVTRISAAHGRDDRASIRNDISSSFITFIAISAFILAAFYLTRGLFNWPSVFNVQSPIAKQEASSAAVAFACCFALSIPVNLVQKVQIGLQKSFIASLWNSAGSVLSLASLIFATQLKLSLPWLVIALMGSPIAIGLLNTIVFFVFVAKDISPTRRAFSPKVAQAIAKSGFVFLVLQLVVAVAYSSDSIIISHVLGPALVPQYAVPERMFALVAMVIAMGLGPLWPAYGEAISRGDLAWVKRTLWKSVGLAAGTAAIVSTAIAFAGPTLLHLWVGKVVVAPVLLLVGLAVWKTIEATSNALAMFLNGAHVVKFQLAVASITGAVTVALKILFVRDFGISGTVWASITAYALCAAIPYTLRMRALLTELSKAP